MIFRVAELNIIFIRPGSKILTVQPVHEPEEGNLEGKPSIIIKCKIK